MVSSDGTGRYRLVSRMNMLHGGSVSAIAVPMLACISLALVSVSKSGESSPNRGMHEAPGGKRVQLRMRVFDAKEGFPIELAHVVLRREGRIIAQDATNAAGVIVFRDIEPGQYAFTAWFVGYKTDVDSVRVGEANANFTIRLRPSGDVEEEVEVVGNAEKAVSHIDLVSGNQVLEAESYHPAPTARMTNLIQENVMGAARAPTGEVHIRGQHGEFTYYVDGIPVPLGVFGGLNEVVDPKVIDRATFITGGFPAEYGGQMSAIIDLNNRVPTGAFHLDFSTYGGSYLVFNGTKPFSPGREVLAGTSSPVPADTLGARVGPFRALNSNGLFISVSDHVGKLGFYLSGSRQETDRRIDTPTPRDVHDHGFDYFLYGKFDYVLSNTDYLTANINFGNTDTEVPFDPSQGIALDDQVTNNAFQTLSYFHVLNSESDEESNLFIGGFTREGGLEYLPGAGDPPNFIFNQAQGRRFVIIEDRSFTTAGVRSTFDRRFSPGLMFKAGLNMSSTRGREDFSSRDSLGLPGPSVVTNFAGSDVGVFLQMEWHPLDWASLEPGVRYDQHIAPDVLRQWQVSPRIRVNFLIDASSSAYLYYGRLFMPTNVEGLRALALNVSRFVTPAVAERDHFFEAVYTRDLSSGFRFKCAAFHKHAAPFTDDATLGSSAVKTPFNIAVVNTSGLELGMSYADPSMPFSAYVNSSVIHAVGSGALTGGFQPPGSDGVATDLDHDQRLSLVLGGNYQSGDWFFNVEANYGSGLSNGSPGSVPAYGTGLFDFNTPAHASPAWLLNCGAGHTYHLEGEVTLESSLYVTNLLNHLHLLKGAYTTGSSWEEPRNVVLKFSVHI